jgi:hypothetical protein
MAKKGQAKGRSRRREKEGRPERWRAYKQYFLIVCEDEVTEPTYFEKFKALFPQNTLFLRTVGTGRDPLGVVHAAVQKRIEIMEESRREIDFTWVVFDKDDADDNFSKMDRFDQAFQIASNENLNIAMSNEVFELWFLLHFFLPDYESPIPRKDVYAMLEHEIRKLVPDFIYIHGKPDMVDYINQYGNEKLAIYYAKELDKFHQGNKPIMCNPSTQVYKLVEILRSWILFYEW